MEVKVVDNFLPEEDHKFILEKLTGYEHDFPWYISNDITFAKVNHPNLYYFIHNFYRDDSINSKEYYWLKEKLLSKLDIKSLIRAKANLYPSAIKLNNHDLHSDFEYSHKGAIYYLNTNNGYTNFEDGTKIESVANRIMFFDSSTLHNSTDCTDNKYRLNININYF